MKYKCLFVVFFLFTTFYVLLIQFDFFNKIDLLIYQWSNSLSGPKTDVFWRMFTLLGETETLAIFSFLIVAFLLWQKKIQEIILFIFLMSSGILLTFSLKLIIQKDRPGEVEYIDFWGLGKDIVSYSFPSGHAAKSLLLIGFIIWFIRKNYQNNKYLFFITILLVMSIALCGMGQVILQEHYISDVIGGYLIGFSCHVLSLWMYSSWKERLERSNITYRKVQKMYKERGG